MAQATVSAKRPARGAGLRRWLLPWTAGFQPGWIGRDLVAGIALGVVVDPARHGIRRVGRDARGHRSICDHGRHYRLCPSGLIAPAGGRPGLFDLNAGWRRLARLRSRICLYRASTQRLHGSVVAVVNGGEGGDLLGGEFDGADHQESAELFEVVLLAV